MVTQQDVWYDILGTRVQYMYVSMSYTLHMDTYTIVIQ